MSSVWVLVLWFGLLDVPHDAGFYSTEQSCKAAMVSAQLTTRNHIVKARCIPRKA